MSITPLDIQNKEFERAFRGYDIEDVDDFLDRIAKDLEALLRENLEMKERVEKLQEKNKNYHKMEATMHNAIVIAQETAEEVKNSARREADLIKREAERDARQMLEDARLRSSRVMEEHEDLIKQGQVFKMRFRSFMEAQIAALEKEEWLDDKKQEQVIEDKFVEAEKEDFAPSADYDFKEEDLITEPGPDFQPDFKEDIETDYEPRVEYEDALGPKDEEDDDGASIDFEPHPGYKLGPDDDYDSDPEF